MGLGARRPTRYPRTSASSEALFSRAQQAQQRGSVVSRLDPRGPLVIDTHELGRRPGSQRSVTRLVAAPPDLGNAVIGIAADSSLDLELRLESVVEGVLVTGTARGRAVGECVRCLGTVDLPVEVGIQELYAYPESRQGPAAGLPDEDDEHDLHLIEDDLMDLEPVLRDSAVLALPLQPLCRDDCPGLCSQCGTRLADEPDHHHDTVDHRWAALSSLQPASQEEN